MLNETMAALKERLSSLSGFVILGPEYVIALSRKSQTAMLKVTGTQLPAIFLNYQRIKIEKKGGGFRYYLHGSILVAVSDLKLDTAAKTLFDYVTGGAGVYKKLLECPTPAVSGVHIRMDVGEAYTVTLNEELASTCLAMNIPCDIEFNLP